MQNKKDELAELRDLLYRYLRLWKWFVLSIVSFVTIAILYIKIKDPVYQVNSNILVKEDDKGGAAKGASLMRSMGVGFPGSMDVQDELYTLSSFSLIRQAVDSLSLYITYKENKLWFKKDIYGESPVLLKVDKHVVDTLGVDLTFNIKVKDDGLVNLVMYDGKGYKLKLKNQSYPIKINSIFGDFTLVEASIIKKNKPNNIQITMSGLDIATEGYMKEIDIYLADKKANVLSLNILGTNVKKSKDLLNMLINLYNQDASKEKNILSQNTSEFIKNRLEILNVELADAEKAVEDFKKKNKLVDLGLESKALFDQSGEIKAKLIEVTSELTVLEEIDATLRNRENQYELLPISIGISNEGLIKSVMEYNQLLLERQRLLNTAHDQNPVYKNLESNILSLRVNILASLRNTAASLRIAQTDLDRQMSQFYERFSDAPTIEKEFLVIKRNQLIKEGLVVFLMEKREENALSAAMNAPKARIIDAAYKNHKPVAPKKIVVLLISLVLGLIVPVVIVYLRDILIRTFSSKEEFERISDLPIIGEICVNDNPEGVNKNIVVTRDSVSPIAELFRLIRTNLQFILTKKDEKVILVTSTQGGEGKSFISLNLAVGMALTNKKIVLVGSDIRKPMLAKYLGVSNKNGLTNYLVNENVTLNDIVCNDIVIQNLDIIVAGPIPPNPGELLLSDRLKQLFDELRSKYDYVIIDSAPVGLVSDSFSLAPYSDMTLYVVRANYSDKKSLDFIQRLQITQRLKKLYLVINGTQIKKGNSYGYGYGFDKK